VDETTFSIVADEAGAGLSRLRIRRRSQIQLWRFGYGRGLQCGCSQYSHYLSFVPREQIEDGGGWRCRCLDGKAVAAAPGSRKRPSPISHRKRRIASIIATTLVAAKRATNKRSPCAAARPQPSAASAESAASSRTPGFIQGAFISHLMWRLSV